MNEFWSIFSENYRSFTFRYWQRKYILFITTSE